MEDETPTPENEAVFFEATIATCAQCHCQSALTDLFVSQKERTLCPPCAAQENQIQLRKWRLTGVIVLVTAEAIAGMGLLAGKADLFYTLNNIIGVGLFSYPLLIIHQLAHAAAAWSTGGHVFALHFGTGKKLVQTKIGQLRLALGRWPMGGACINGYPTLDHIHWRIFIWIAAGPLIHVALNPLLQPDLNLARWPTTLAWREALYVANLLLLGVSLVPRSRSVLDLSRPSDGQVLIDLLRGQLDLKDLHASYFFVAGNYAGLDKNYEAELAISLAGLASYPDNSTLRYQQASALLHLEQWEAALALFRVLMAQPTADQRSRLLKAMCCNDAAWALVLKGDPADLKAAQTYAQQSFEVLPWLAAIQGTWGAVLVELGQIEPGIDYLLKSLEGEEPLADKVGSIAYLAIGYHKLGQPEQALAWLKQAEALNEKDVLVQRARQAMTTVGLSD